MRIYDCKILGEYYTCISRVAFINVEFLDVFFKFIPETKWKEVGQEIEKMAIVSLEASMDIETSNKEKWVDVFKRLRIQGFGDFCLKDKFIITRTLLISNSKFLWDFIEILIGEILEVRTASLLLVFELVE
ncbi:MAG: hypothetical protein ACOWW1_01370 [archaeon]|nr:hypothetical protein [Candidatus Bathyarchaeum sp.]